MQQQPQRGLTHPCSTTCIKPAVIEPLRPIPLPLLILILPMLVLLTPSYPRHLAHDH